MHICVSRITIIGSDNGLSPGQRQAIIWTNAGILLIWNLGTNFNEILSEIHTFSFKKMHLKISSVKWRPFCLGLSVLSFSVKEALWMLLMYTWLLQMWFNEVLHYTTELETHGCILSHLYCQCWLTIHLIGLISCRNVIFILNIITKFDHIFKWK